MDFICRRLNKFFDFDDISVIPENANSSKSKKELKRFFSVSKKLIFIKNFLPHDHKTSKKNHKINKIKIYIPYRNPEGAFINGSLFEQWIDEYFLCFYPKYLGFQIGVIIRGADEVIHGFIKNILSKFFHQHAFKDFSKF